ncbi:hypothetical protein [Amycolatopsis vastitatis]|uniref:Shikimate dehydrogenase substrate binding N-terminal domain-containing protein n=1 Tax=Amycolatopsis vastitatis TaxID=1905142 RepID=A0A229TAQ2_9PSEU|nr:hypothetical protein [Amycolatopsis vastitatis]OXM68228.1 hypothetical protein CF165_13850 [Amycolatopsis vastitatis]
MTARDGRFLIRLIGSGIGTSLSPPLHEREAGKLGPAHLDALSPDTAALGEVNTVVFTGQEARQGRVAAHARR